MLTTEAVIPLDLADPINARILAASEDRIQGFQRDPVAEIARLADVSFDLVVERLRALLEGGVIRRIRQTLLATSLADGALCAGVGQRTAAALAARPLVSCLWPGPDAGGLSLIADGEAQVRFEGDTALAVIVVSWAVRHRPPGL